MKMVKSMIGTVSNMHYFYYPWEYFLEHQKKLGAESIDLFAGMPHMWIDHYAWYGCSEIKRSVQKQGMNLVLFTPKTYNYCIFAPEGLYGDMSEHYYKNCISAARELGISNVALSLNKGYEDYSPELLREKGRKRLSRLGRMAEEYGITLLLEAGETENFLFQTIQQAGGFFESADCRSFKLSLNIRTAGKAGALLAQWVNAFPKELQYVRFHNEFAPEALEQAGYCGMWGVCISDDSQWDKPEEAERRIYNFPGGQYTA